MTAVLVIDMLNDFFREGPLAEEREALAAHVNALVGRARERDWPVLWIRQTFAPDLSDAFLDMRDHGIRATIEGTEGARLLAELDRHADDPEIVKKRYSAFFETPLDAMLRDLDVETLILAGVNTHACVRMAAIDAYQRDLRVVIVRECVASYDAEYHAVSLRYLESSGIAQVRALGDVFPAQD